MPTPAVAPSSTSTTEIDKLWKPGNSINLAIGQGDLEATPLQLAVDLRRRSPTAATIVTPHLGLKVVDAAGQDWCATSQPAPPRKVDISQATLDVVRRGLYDAAALGPTGTSSAVFAGYPVPVAGKTGTAEV